MNHHTTQENVEYVTALFKCYLDVSCINAESTAPRCSKLTRVITISICKSLSRLTLHEWCKDLLHNHISRECGLEATVFTIQAIYIPVAQHNCDVVTSATTSAAAAPRELAAMKKAAVNGLLYMPSELTETNQKWYAKLDVDEERSSYTVMADVLLNSNNNDCKYNSNLLPTSNLPIYEIVVEIIVDNTKLKDEEKWELTHIENSGATNNECNSVSACPNNILFDIAKLCEAERKARDELADVQTCEFELIAESNKDMLRQVETLQQLQGNSIENGQLASFLRKSRRYPFDTTPLYLTEHEKQLHRSEYSNLVQEAETTVVLSRAFDRLVNQQCSCSISSDGHEDTDKSNGDHAKPVASSFRAALQYAIDVERKAAQRTADELARVRYYTDADLPVPPRPETPVTPREVTMEDIPDDVYDNTLELFLEGRRDIATRERVAYRELVSLMQQVLRRQREADAYAVSCAALSELKAAASIFQLDTYITSQELLVSIYHDQNDMYSESIENTHNNYNKFNESKSNEVPPEYKISVSWQADQGAETKKNANNNRSITNSNNIASKNNYSSGNKRNIPVPMKHIDEVHQIQDIMHTLRARATVTLEARMERQVMLHCETKQRHQIVDEESEHYAQIKKQKQFEEHHQSADM